METDMHGAYALPQRLHDQKIRQLAAIVLGTAFLTLSSYIEVPMFPVPMTMQTLAVTGIGALYGWRLGMATVFVWLTEAALGLPVLAGGASGLAPFIGPTAGYLFVFPSAAALTGWLVSRSGKNIVLNLAAMLAGNALCLCGALWLAFLIGPQKAILLGGVPFVAGGVVKSAMGAVGLKLLGK
jgi:biotin transport system substrate-specific component